MAIVFLTTANVCLFCTWRLTRKIYTPVLVAFMVTQIRYLIFQIYRPQGTMSHFKDIIFRNVHLLEWLGSLEFCIGTDAPRGIFTIINR